MNLLKCAKSKHGPGRLRRSACSLAAQLRIFIRRNRLSPAAVCILMSFQPIPTALDPNLIHIHANSTQPAQNLRRTIDIVDPPTTIPRAVRFLLLLQEMNGPINFVMPRPKAEIPEDLQDASGYVATTRIQNSVMIGKRDVFEQRVLYILVECGPATISVLKTQQPPNNAIV